MSLLTTIDNIPLYDTMQEALIWGSQYNLQGYHIHYFNGIKGYMSGENHQQVNEALLNGVQNILTPTQLLLGSFLVNNTEINYYANLESQAIANVISSIPTQNQASTQVASQPSTPQSPTPYNQGSGGSGY